MNNAPSKAFKKYVFEKKIEKQKKICNLYELIKIGLFLTI